MPKVYIRTFGCQMNTRDSELVMGMLLEKGFLKAEAMEDADIILFSTCSVRKHAEDRLFAALYRLREFKKAKPDLVIGVTGCTAQACKHALFGRFPHIDFICGPSNIYEVPDILRRFEIASPAFGGLAMGKKGPGPFSNGKQGKEVRPLFARNDGAYQKIAAVDLDKRPLTYINPDYRQNQNASYVNISFGCDNFCSYCIVPYVRGREVSRPRGMILDEIKDLAERGCKEVVLLGQNVNSYRDPETRSGKSFGFVDLLKTVSEINGIEKIRFMTSHPKDASLELFKAMRDIDKLVRHLHLPLQSGSDRILKLMNRGYTLKSYMEKAKFLRSVVPDVKFSTDIIVGFPTEKERDFAKTREVMEDIKFDKTFIFKYSPRPPAKAAQMKDDVPEDVKKKRNKILLDLQKEIFKSYKGEPVHVP